MFDDEGREWQPTAGLTLDDNQLLIAQYQGNQAISAGPGAGKTEVLANLVCHRLQTGAVAEPRRILALSFKRDSATNLARRVLARVPEHARRFDSFTLDALTKGVLDRFRCALPPELEVPAHYELAFQGGLGEVPIEPEDQVTYGIWQARVARRPCRLTFGEIARLARFILQRNPRLVQAMNATYPVVLLDEFQDTTADQYGLLAFLFKDTACEVHAVGDPNQRIMGFANALEDGLETFTTDFEAVARWLPFNYRSTDVLLGLQAELLPWLNKDTQPSSLGHVGDERASTIAFEEVQDLAAERAAMVAWVQAQLNDGVAPERVAVLVRHKDAGRRIADALVAAGMESRHDEYMQNLVAEPICEAAIDLVILASTGIHGAEWGRQMRNVRLTASASGRPPDEPPGTILSGYVQEVKQLVASEPLTQECCKILFDSVMEFFGEGALACLHPQYVAPGYLRKLRQEFAQGLAACGQQRTNIADAARLLRGDGLVQALTVHKSKGLEFEAIGILHANPGTYGPANGDDTSIDAKRELFVALSRAEQHLLVTRSADNLALGTPLDAMYSALRNHVTG